MSQIRLLITTVSLPHYFHLWAFGQQVVVVVDFDEVERVEGQ